MRINYCLSPKNVTEIMKTIHNFKNPCHVAMYILCLFFFLIKRNEKRSQKSKNGQKGGAIFSKSTLANNSSD